MTVIFVFGSNLAGRHGKGAALAALQHHGAIYGRGTGPQGSAYAIPTKDVRLRPLPLSEIAEHARCFVAYARNRPHLTFELTRIGCGLAGYAPDQIAPLFAGVSDNVNLPKEFDMILRKGRGGKLSKGDLDALGQGLRKQHAAVASEPLPASMREQLVRLDLFMHSKVITPEAA